MTATTGMEFATSLSEVSQLGLEMHVFNVQAEASRRLEQRIHDNESASRKMAFVRQLVPVVYTGLAYVALVAAVGAVALVDSVNLTSAGAVMLIMLRSLSYGQGVQTSITSIHASDAVPRCTRPGTAPLPIGAGRRSRSTDRSRRRSPARQRVIRIRGRRPGIARSQR